MKTTIRKTTVVEFEESEAFAIRHYLELAANGVDLKDAPEGSIKSAQKLIEQISEAQR